MRSRCFHVKWVLLAALAAPFALGCDGDAEQTTASTKPAQAPGVEGMQWLKKHGYVDQNGRPTPEKRQN